MVKILEPAGFIEGILYKKKVIVTKGRHKGVSGYVKHEDRHAVTIFASGLFGDTGWYGMYYARTTDIKRIK